MKFDAEDGWMRVHLEPASSPGKLELTLEGLQGVRGGKFTQSVELDAEQRIELALELIEGTGWALRFERDGSEGAVIRPPLPGDKPKKKLRHPQDGGSR